MRRTEISGEVREAAEILSALIRSVVADKPLSAEARLAASGKSACAPALVYAVAAAHDLAHLAAEALDREAILDALPAELADRYRKCRYKAIWRCERGLYEEARLREAFSREGVDFIPLKGSVMRTMWPEPWMRTCHDIDIMVRACDVERAVAFLTESLGYRRETLTSHDVTLVSPGNVLLELHHSMFYKLRGTAAADVAATVWDHAVPTGGGTEFALDAAMFRFLHVAHMVEHFEGGGCGLRPFVDLWLLQRERPDGGGAEALFERGGLTKFRDASVLLAEHIMDARAADENTLAFEDYIVNGGVYGNLENQVAVGVAKDPGRRGRLAYIRSRMFLPYESLSNIYPIIKKRRWLTPVMQIRRWGDGIVNKGARRYAEELRLSRGVSDAERSAASGLRRYLGL